MEFPLGTKNHQRKAVDKFVARKKKYSPRHYRFQQDGHKFLDFLFSFFGQDTFSQKNGSDKRK